MSGLGAGEDGVAGGAPWGDVAAASSEGLGEAGAIADLGGGAGLAASVTGALVRTVWVWGWQEG